MVSDPLAATLAAALTTSGGAAPEIAAAAARLARARGDADLADTAAAAHADPSPSPARAARELAALPAPDGEDAALHAAALTTAARRGAPPHAAAAARHTVATLVRAASGASPRGARDAPRIVESTLILPEHPHPILLAHVDRRAPIPTTVVHSMSAHAAARWLAASWRRGGDPADDAAALPAATHPYVAAFPGVAEALARVAVADTVHEISRRAALRTVATLASRLPAREQRRLRRLADDLADPVADARLATVADAPTRLSQPSSWPAGPASAVAACYDRIGPRDVAAFVDLVPARDHATVAAALLGARPDLVDALVAAPTLDASRAAGPLLAHPVAGWRAAATLPLGALGDVVDAAPAHERVTAAVRAGHAVAATLARLDDRQLADAAAAAARWGGSLADLAATVAALDRPRAAAQS